uniref:Uncharacterized protein n=1 Tax=Rhizophora mucronata TaxID=61149 RepID=A0A2P2R381_RHIMU
MHYFQEVKRFCNTHQNAIMLRNAIRTI